MAECSSGSDSDDSQAGHWTRVVHGDVMSSIVDATSSVQQRSARGPLFVSLYMADLADQVAQYAVSLRA